MHMLQQTLEKSKVKEFRAFLTGKVVSIEEVPDLAFSRRVLGDGLAIIPFSTTVVAPADGIVSYVLDDCKYACGMYFPAFDMEIMFHIGIDTFDMNGDGFELKVKQGDKVRMGDPLIKFDADKIMAAGHPIMVMMVVTDAGQAKNFSFHTEIAAYESKTVIMSFE